jgi:hypothetical protein
LFRFVEGEAEGRFAIAALVFLVVAAVVASFILRAFISEPTCSVAIARGVARPAVVAAALDAMAPSMPIAIPRRSARRRDWRSGA